MGHLREQTPFLCTFCWTTQYPPSRPKSLGSEKRICCQGCYEQLLDLAICWVCGEVVVRGDEVVSLGWCFWHRGCFGCLICGQPVELDFQELEANLGHSRGRGASFRANKTGNKMKDEIEEVRQGRKRKAMAVELDEIPVCRGCDTMLVETGAHREEVGMFLGRGNVSQHDGGLGEARWKRLRRTNTDIDAAPAPRAQSPSSNARKLANLFESSEAGHSGVSFFHPRRQCIS